LIALAQGTRTAVLYSPVDLSAELRGKLDTCPIEVDDALQTVQSNMGIDLLEGSDKWTPRDGSDFLEIRNGIMEPRKICVRYAPPFLLDPYSRIQVKPYPYRYPNFP